MRIAIVEDEKDVALHLIDMLNDYSKKHVVEVESVYFSSAVTFLDKYRSDFDLVAAEGIKDKTVWGENRHKFSN